MPEPIACSACLLGIACKYDGGSNFDPSVLRFLAGRRVVPVCPEVLGGLPTPRIPCEIQPDGTVRNRAGEDVTAFFERGKQAALALLQKEGCREVLLKDGSPSCGFSRIYDGTFTNRRIPGMGITARYLKDHGITILDIREKGQR